MRVVIIQAQSAFVKIYELSFSRKCNVVRVPLEPTFGRTARYHRGIACRDLGSFPSQPCGEVRGLEEANANLASLSNEAARELDERREEVPAGQRRKNGQLVDP